MTRKIDSATVPRSSIVRWEMPIDAERVVDVANDRRHDHRADVGRQRPAERCEPGAHPRARRRPRSASPRGASGARRLRRPRRPAWPAWAPRSARSASCSSGTPACTRRAHAVTTQQVRADRPAQQAARHDADHRRRHRQRGGAGARRRSRRAARTPSPVAGPPVSVTEPASTPEQRVLAERHRHHGADARSAAPRPSTPAPSSPPPADRRGAAGARWRRSRPTRRRRSAAASAASCRRPAAARPGYRAAPGWPRPAGRRRRAPECCSGQHRHAPLQPVADKEHQARRRRRSERGRASLVWPLALSLEPWRAHLIVISMSRDALGRSPSRDWPLTCST